MRAPSPLSSPLPCPQGAYPQAPSLHSPPQTFTDAGGITSSFTLGERRVGVEVAGQRGPGPGTALVHRIPGASCPEVLGRDLVSPRGRWESPGVGRGERKKSKEERRKKSENERKGKERGPSSANR